MSRLHPHYFPDDTPEPVAEPYGTACALLDSVCRWIVIAFYVAAGTSSVAAVVLIADVLFPNVFPSLFSR